MRKLRYGMIGRGVWGERIANILCDHSRDVKTFNISRRNKHESIIDYQEKIVEEICRNQSEVDVVWLAVPPGDQYIIVKSVLEFNKDIIVEKPWMCKPDETHKLINTAENKGLQIAVHYQYCFLEELKRISRLISKSDNDVVFSGEFTVSKKNRLNIPSVYNLGFHLLAIKCYFFPEAGIGSIKTGYDQENRRIVRVNNNAEAYMVNFLYNNEPLIQRFIDAFESSIINKTVFPLNMEFSLTVYDEIIKLSRLQPE